MFETIPDINWSILSPAVVAALTGVLALICEMMWPKRTNDRTVVVTVVGLLVSAGLYASKLTIPATDTLNKGYLLDSFGAFMGFLIAVSSVLTVLFSESYLRQRRIPYGEFYALLSWSAFGAMVMATSENLITIFLGLEVLSIALYVMASLNRTQESSQESGLKYFLLGAFASAFLLFGMAFLYGGSGSVQLGDVARVLASGDQMGRFLISFGVCMIIVGLGFKCAFVPFHQWAPDVYQGAPTNVTSFMAAVSKIAAFAALWRVLEATREIQAFWMPILTVIAALTMFIPNVMALTQKDVKRILGYSSISNSGYMLVGLLANIKRPDIVSEDILKFYLFAYIFMTIGGFAVLSLCAKNNQDKTEIDDLRGLRKRQPFAAACLFVVLISLIGVPPTGGFFAKFKIFVGAIQADMLFLSIVLAISSVISIYYYLGILKAIFVSENEEDSALEPQRSGVGVSAFICALGSLFAAVLLAAPFAQFLTSQR